MDLFEAIILGVLQGLTEFLPVSSSGHLEIGKFLFGIDPESSFGFSIAVHGATVLSTLVVFRKEIYSLIGGLFRFKYNEETKYVFKIFVSLIPVLIVGLLFKEQVESLFNGNIIFVGIMLFITAALLFIASRIRDGGRVISYLDAFIIGIAQAFAVVPGISRSGATISTGMMLGNRRDDLARFSFLMVLIPVIGANILEVIKGDFASTDPGSAIILLAGFISAFITGYLACTWMINLVKKGKFFWFGVYCLVIGLIALFIG
jgi:undecaprenyl-diphosphatase